MKDCESSPDEVDLKDVILRVIIRAMTDNLDFDCDQISDDGENALMQTYWKCCPKTWVSAFRSATENDDDEDNVKMNMMTMTLLMMVFLKNLGGCVHACIRA